MILWLALLASGHATQFGLTVDQSVVSSRWDYASTSTFSLLAKDASKTRVLISAGGRVLEVIGGVEFGNFKYVPPETRTLSLDQMKTTSGFGGLRAKAKFAWLSLTYRSEDTLYLVEKTPTTFDLRKTPASLAIASLTLFGFGQFYRLAMDADVGGPLSSGSTPIGQLRYMNFARAIGRIEFGGKWRIGFHAGIESATYRIEAAAFTRSDSIIGVTISIGGDKKSWLAQPPAPVDYAGNYPGT